MDYPHTRRDDTVDTLHGHEVADPYRWLEDPDAPETRAWVAEQNRLTRTSWTPSAPVRGSTPP